VGAALQKAGAEVRVFDMRPRFSFRSLKREIEAFGPHRIGLALRNVDNAAYPAFRFYLPFYQEITRFLRRTSKAPIILGGSAFSLFPHKIASELGADGGVVGEGEPAAHDFLELDHGRIIKASLLEKLRFSFPDNLGRLFPGLSRYKTIGIQTARGCPNKCIYCTCPSLEGRRRTNRSPEMIADDISRLYRDFNIKNFFIVDSLFNGDEAHMARVLEAIAGLRLPVRFSCYMQPKVSDPAIFELLKNAGCVGIDFGTDSGSERMLTALGKPFSRHDIVETSDTCRKTGIDFCHSLIIGGPGETRETIGETIGLMDEICPRAVIAMTGVRIYPGTEMEKIADREGIIREGQSLLNPHYYLSSLVKELPDQVIKMVGRRKNWFFPGKRDWSSTYGYRILNLIYRKGPLWKTFRR